MSANCSYLVIDPKGEMLRSTGRLLEQEKYDIKVFDLIHPQQSDGYNPFTYIRDEPDVLKLMDNLVKNTTQRSVLGKSRNCAGFCADAVSAQRSAQGGAEL